jgi:hypothetical protein
MGLSQFIAWATAQGFKNRKFLVKAYNSFKGKFPGKDVILKTARNFYDKAIAKVPTKKIADKIRQDIKKDRPKRFEWEPQKNFDARLRAIVDKHKANPRSAKIIPFPKRPPGKAEGGIAGLKNGGSTQKDIDKGIAAIEKLKPGLMPESYKALIELYKKKQKDLNIDIMESAGGLGEMLGEGGRAGFKKGTKDKRRFWSDKWGILDEEWDLRADDIDSILRHLKAKKSGGRIGFQRAGTVPYLSRGWSQPGVLKAPRGYTGMQDILKYEVPAAASGIALALRQKDKDKQVPTKTEGPKLPDPKPPFKLFDLIADFIAQHGRQPKAREELQLKEKIRVAKEKFTKAAEPKAISKAISSDEYLEELDKRIMDEMDLTKSVMDSMSSTALDDLRRNADPIGMEQNLGEITPGRGVGDFPNDPFKEPEGIENIKNITPEIEKLPAPQELLEDLVEVKEDVLDPKTNKVTTQYNTYKRSDKTRPPTKEELEDDYGELWNEEQSPLDFGSTIEELDAALEEQRSYERYMYDQYKTGKLDKYMSMDAKIERVRSADDAGRPSGYDPDEEEEIRAAADEKEDRVIAKMNEAEELAKAKASGSPWYTDPKIPSPEEELRKSFPGISDEIIKSILTNTDPKRTAEVIQTLHEIFKMQDKGTSTDDIIKTLKDKTKKAAGGIISLQEGGPPSILNPPSKPRRKYISKKSYPPGASSAAKRYADQRLWERRKEEEAFEGIWAGAPPSMKEREKMYRVQRTARMMEEDRIEAFEKKMYDRRKLYPYAEMTEKEFAKAHPKVYDMMKKDPAWNWEIFKTISFANPGETFQATGAQEIEPAVPLGMWSTSGRHDPGELELFMTPFGVTNYEMSSAGPFNKKKIMSDYDKASVAIHEMRHKKILQDEELTAAQPPLAVEEIAWRNRDPSDYPVHTIDDIPEMVEPKAPPVYRHANPPGSEKEFSSPLGMHEVFNRFVNRQYSPLTTPSGPYFDKIWRDKWQPYADKYEKILKKRKDPEEGLRVLGNEGGIARRPNAVPPLSGPTPQGLTFLLGDDIVKSRIK